MCKIFTLTLICLSCCLTTISANTKEIKAAREVIERAANNKNTPIELTIEQGETDTQTYFEYWVSGGILSIKASSQTALCRGFYDYVKSNHFGIYSWSGNNIKLPERLKDSPRKRVVSPFQYHYMSNVVVYGYTKPYWDWERWSQEIDWLAIHGVDMPLALVGTEAILARVWSRMGLTDDEINNYFSGPAHLPWLRMGNLSKVDGPLNNHWHKGQIELQHKILNRMRSLGMKPICPGFPGFLPEAFKRLYPDLELVKTSWAGAFNNWMISPEQDLFSTIGTEFIKEWEKEFGKNEHYLIDSFNEMEIPFPEKGTKERYELLTSYGDKVYNSIRNANPNAKWVMQGWMFGYQRNIWDYETLQSLVAKVPDNKMLLLDLAVDYNKHFWHSETNWEFHRGFHNKPWIYSVIPNMGGKTGLTGVLEFYANGHLEALNSPNKGRLVGFGAAPEGIENNEVIYELIFDAGWKDTKIDLREWLKEYSINRYGGYSTGIHNYWTDMLGSVYGTFTDHPRYNWQFRPALMSNGSININDDFFSGIESFISDAPLYKYSPLYMADLAEMTALYLGGKVELLIKAIDKEYIKADTIRAIKLEKDFEHIMLTMDALLESHPNLRLQRWIDFAHKHAINEEQYKRYESNAKRIVTIWGPPIDDYSARVWSGLIRDYYLPRWQHYFASRKSGKGFNFVMWENSWVEHSVGLSKAIATDDLMNTARTIVDYTAFIDNNMLSINQNQIGGWSIESGKGKLITVSIPSDKLHMIKNITLTSSAEAKPTIAKFELMADGKSIYKTPSELTWAADKNILTIPVTIANDVRGNNGVELILELINESNLDSSGDISLDF